MKKMISIVIASILMISCMPFNALAMNDDAGFLVGDWSTSDGVYLSFYDDETFVLEWGYLFSEEGRWSAGSLSGNSFTIHMNGSKILTIMSLMYGIATNDYHFEILKCNNDNFFLVQVYDNYTAQSSPCKLPFTRDGASSNFSYESNEIYDEEFKVSDNRKLIDTMLKTPSTEYNNELALIAAELAFKTYDDGMRDDTSVKNYLHYDLGFEWDNIKSYSVDNEYNIISSPSKSKIREGYGDYFSFTTARIDYSDTSVLVIIAQGTSSILNNEGIYDKFTGTSNVNGYTVFNVVNDFYKNIYNYFDSVIDKKKNYKILLTGHSLGGAAVNWTAERIIDGHNDKVKVLKPKEDVYCYTFGAINSIRSSSLIENGYKNIHNIYNNKDELYSGAFLGALANLGTGMFEKYGKFGSLETFNYDYASEEAKNNEDVKQGEFTPNHSNYLEAVKSGRIILVSVDGEKLDFDDMTPTLVNGRTLVPLRAIFEALGATVDWNDKTQTVTAKRKKTTVKITVGDNKLYVNGSAIELDVPAQIINDRTLVPVRAVSEAFGCKVDWNEITRTVSISSKSR